MVFFLQGDGANGKTTFLEMIRALMGPYAHRAGPDLLTAAQGERHPTELAALAGARIVICSEVEDGRRWATQRFKELSGEPVITARRMRQDPVMIPVTWKLFIAANHDPDVRDHSEAFWRRLHKVPFNVGSENSLGNIT